MSIYCSRVSLGKDWDGDSTGHVLAYPGNNLLRLDGLLWPEAWAGTAHIPHWLDPAIADGLLDPGTDEPLAPWLRLEVGTEGVHAFVLIDEDAARALAADLLAWAETPKTRTTTNTTQEEKP